jgi:cell division protease FtsH
MITEYGMSDKLGPMTFGHGPMEQVFLGRDISRDRNYSEKVAASIDEEMKRMITEAYNRAEELIRTHRDKLDAIVQALLEKETLEAADFERLLTSGEEQETPPAVDAQAAETQDGCPQTGGPQTGEESFSAGQGG